MKSILDPRIMNLGSHADLRPVPRMFPPIHSGPYHPDKDNERILTPAAQSDRDAFERFDNGCSCHHHPPCDHCTHPGNPLNQEDDEFWMYPKTDFNALGTFAERNAKRMRTCELSDPTSDSTCDSSSKSPIGKTAEPFTNSTHWNQSPISPSESDPTSRGWVPQADHWWSKDQYHLQHHSVGYWSCTHARTRSVLCPDGNFRDFTTGPTVFPDWREIDELLFEREPQERDGFERTELEREWEFQNGKSHGYVKCYSTGSWGFSSMESIFDSWALLKRAMRKAGVLK